MDTRLIVISPKTCQSGDKNRLYLLFFRFYIPVNSQDHVEMVSSPNHNLGKLDEAVNQSCTIIFSLVTENSPS